MKNYIAICILTAHIFSGTLFSAEMTHADTTLCGLTPHKEQELRVAVLELMLNAKLSYLLLSGNGHAQERVLLDNNSVFFLCNCTYFAACKRIH
jgi:hypothetical protein